MGRGKIEIKKIENANSRQVTFSKRRAGLLKKARELAILCDAEVAVIIFSSTDKLYQYASSDMRRILSRYCDSSNTDENEVGALKLPQNADSKELENLRNELAKLQVKQTQLSGKQLAGLSFKELQQLEEQLHDGLLSVKDRKEKLLMEQLEISRSKEQKAQLENEKLRRQIAELQGCLPSAEQNQMMRFLECHPDPVDRKCSSEKNGVLCSELAIHSEMDKEDSDITLHLGLSTHAPKKRKTDEKETYSNDSDMKPPEKESSSSKSGSQIGPI
ncbi:hypothetical protein Dimus_023310 [Dionaea muscipula]